MTPEILETRIEVYIMSENKPVATGKTLKTITNYAAKHAAGVRMLHLMKSDSGPTGALLVTFDDGAFCTVRFAKFSELVDWVYSRRSWQMAHVNYKIITNLDHLPEVTGQMCPNRTTFGMRQLEKYGFEAMKQENGVVNTMYTPPASAVIDPLPTLEDGSLTPAEVAEINATVAEYGERTDIVIAQHPGRLTEAEKRYLDEQRMSVLIRQGLALPNVREDDGCFLESVDDSGDYDENTEWKACADGLALVGFFGDPLKARKALSQQPRNESTHTSIGRILGISAGLSYKISYLHVGSSVWTATYIADSLANGTFPEWEEELAH